MILVCELMSSDIRGVLQELVSKLAEHQIKNIFYQMLKAIKYSHTHDIVHRDIKLENFLMDCSDDGNIVIKLTDFGLACTFDPEHPPTQKCGSLLSAAPELLINKEYCHKVDLWGLGIILHELLSTKLPFYSDDDRKYKDNIVN